MAAICGRVVSSIAATVLSMTCLAPWTSNSLRMAASLAGSIAPWGLAAGRPFAGGFPPCAAISREAQHSKSASHTVLISSLPDYCSCSTYLHSKGSHRPEYDHLGRCVHNQLEERAQAESATIPRMAPVTSTIILPGGLFFYQVAPEDIRRFPRWMLWLQTAFAAGGLLAAAFGASLD